LRVPKVVGLEQEYGIFDLEDNNSNPIASSFLLVNSYENKRKTIWDYNSESPMADARGFSQKSPDIDIDDEENSRINNILANGARFYVDHAHPEYSTPECTNAYDLVCCDKAGMRILNDCQHRIREKNNRKEIMIYKNNSDNKGNSYGCHENYLMSSESYSELFHAHNSLSKKLTNILIPFFVTRQIFCGAGKVGSEASGNNVDYQISQRADFFETLVDSNTTHQRPIVNSRDEPHADRERFRRLHVIVGDANMSEYSTYLKIGTTQIVLLMIEDDFFDPGLALMDPLDSIRVVSRDLTCKNKILLADGSYLSPIDIQKEFLLAAKKYLKTLPDEEIGIYSDIIIKWEFVLNALSDDPMILKDKIDWVIKKDLLDRYIEKRGWHYKSPQIMMMSIKYHDIDPKDGLFNILEREGRVTRIISDDSDIQKFIIDPPEDTRAYFRSKCLKQYREYISGLNWDILRFDTTEGKIKVVPLMNPLTGTKNMVHTLFERKLDIKDFIREITT
jgi:Pup amidohydrolase